MADFTEAYNNILKEREHLTMELEELEVEIKPARLNALPDASLCLKCKSNQPKSNRGRLTG
jgi:RNA polymerase-binding transcription factor DksA